MVNQAIKSDKIAPAVETIFHWQEDGPSHCLLRIYRDDKKQQTVVVISEIASNQGNTSITREFKELITAVVVRLEENIELENKVLWLRHFGQFSERPTYENQYDSELFRQFEYDFESGSPIQKGDETVLYKRNIKALFPQYEICLDQKIENNRYSTTYLNG